MASPKTKTPHILSAIVGGAAYGLLVRVGFEWVKLHPFLQIVSTAFLVLCPVSVGAIAVLWSAGKEPMPVAQQIKVSTLAIAVFLVAMFASLLEGLICLVLVGPVFCVAALVGGLLAGLLHNHFRVNKSTIPAFALLPVLVAPMEGLLPPAQSIQSVTNTIHIAAPPERVFAQLADVQNIRPDELGFAFMHLIGLPKPVAAEMRCDGGGCARTSHWEKNVWFQEVITEWHAPTAMRYRFVIPQGGIPREALDRHVEVGGEYFDLVDGAYELKPSSDGGTELSLTTRFNNKSQLKLYGDLWGSMVLKDFHRSILGLMKHRSEQNTGLSRARYPSPA